MRPAGIERLCSEPEEDGRLFISDSTAVEPAAPLRADRPDRPPSGVRTDSRNGLPVVARPGVTTISEGPRPSVSGLGFRGVRIGLLVPLGAGLHGVVGPRLEFAGDRLALDGLPGADGLGDGLDLLLLHLLLGV